MAVPTAKMSHEQIYKTVVETSILNDDAGIQVARILTNGLLSSDWEFTHTLSTLRDAVHVYQPAASTSGWWSCGYRIPVDDELALQMVGLYTSKFMSYWWETIEPYLDTVLGQIYIIDSGHFSWAQNYIQPQMHITLSANGFLEMPFIFACTRQDSPDAWSIEDIRTALNITPEIPVVPCVATDKESVKNVLLALLVHVRDMPEQEAREEQPDK